MQWKSIHSNFNLIPKRKKYYFEKNKSISVPYSKLQYDTQVDLSPIDLIKIKLSLFTFQKTIQKNQEK